MTITIPLVPGQNYISFPASSPYSFMTIFTISGIINDIGTDDFQNKMFYKYDPVVNNYIIIDLNLGHIEQGKGYYLYVISTTPGAIIYDGVEYTITFDQIKSRIVKGWNLLGTGKDAIIPKSWCNILDPATMSTATMLEPRKAYLIYDAECIEQSSSVGSLVFITASSLSIIWLLKQFKVI